MMIKVRVNMPKGQVNNFSVKLVFESLHQPCMDSILEVADRVSSVLQTDTSSVNHLCTLSATTEPVLHEVHTSHRDNQ